VQQLTQPIEWKYKNMLNDEELEAIRRRKMQLLMERASQPQVEEPMAQGYITELNDSNFWATIGNTKTALVDFYGAWCQPCKALAPILQELATEYKGRVFFAKVDIDRNLALARQFQVQSVPNVFGLKRGKPVGNLTGLRSINDYDIWIGRLLAA
jgi:thioredoxin 1